MGEKTNCHLCPSPEYNIFSYRQESRKYKVDTKNQYNNMTTCFVRAARTLF